MADARSLVMWVLPKDVPLAESVLIAVVVVIGGGLRAALEMNACQRVPSGPRGLALAGPRRARYIVENIPCTARSSCVKEWTFRCFTCVEHGNERLNQGMSSLKA